MSAVLAWLGKEGAGLLLGFLGKLLLDAWNSWQASQAQRELGQVTAERDQAIAGRRAAEQIAEEAAKPLGEDDVIARLDRGEG
jgi:hypothetical protein